MSRFALKPLDSSIERSEYSSTSLNYNNSQSSAPRVPNFIRSASNTSYYGEDFENYQQTNTFQEYREPVDSITSSSIEPGAALQLRNMLGEPHSLTNSLTCPRKKVPSCESKKESKLRFRDEEEFEIFPIFDPSVSRDLSPPPLDRMPLRSCLKQRNNILPTVEENTLRLSQLGQSWIGSGPVADIPTVSERNTSYYLDENGNKQDASCLEVVQSNKGLFDTKKFELDDVEKKLTEKWNNKISKDEKASDVNCPTPVDYWGGTNYKRRNRRIPLIKDIFKATSREIQYEEFIKEHNSTLILVEVGFDYGFLYAKCYVSSDFPLNLVIIPLRCFPIEDDLPPLGSKWRANIQYVHVLCSNRRREKFLRLAYNGRPEFTTMIRGEIPRRTITFGEASSSFYCEMLQMYVPLNQVFDDYYNKEVLFGEYGNVTFNSKILSKLPEGIVIVDGFGWIEPMPGDIGIARKSYVDDAWLLAERYVPTLAHEEFSYSYSLLTDEEILAKQKRAEEEHKERLEYLLKKRAEGYIFYPVEPRNKGKPQTFEGGFSKRDRRQMCQNYLHQIKERGTQIPLFQGELEEQLFELVVPHKQKKGTKLGVLCHIFLNYLRDDKTFNYLKENEPENLEIFRLIVKWSVDYTRDRRNSLPQKLYNFIFPLSDDPNYEGDRWED